MIVESGLISGMVLQRTDRNVCCAAFAGCSDAAGQVEARAMQSGKTLRGYSWINVGIAKNGRFAGRLNGIACGGPYDIRLRIVNNSRILDETAVENILVGDVWILAGQSNMEGRGCGVNLKAVDHVRAFSADDVWRPAQDPMHRLWAAVDEVHRTIRGGEPELTVKCVGPGVSFGQEMLRRTGIPQGLIACANGGTSMKQWSPALKKLKGKSLYGATLRRFHKNGGRVAGVLWYQGCNNAQSAPVDYMRRTKQLINAFRRDFSSPALPFVIVQISKVYAPSTFKNANWNAVQDIQRRLGQTVDHCICVPTVDLGLDDPIHLDAESQDRLGLRLARAAHELIRNKKPMRAIEPAEIRIVEDKPPRTPYVEVRFRNVEGHLQCPIAPTGFALADENGNLVDAIFKIELAGDKALLRVQLPVRQIARLRLYYGFGRSPHVNIADAADRSIPAFGPLRIGRP
ncbi:MAG: sialate O-acetylesterase [Planctomycetes bacterium]|nr:sialate O-acetylesterase [Planctomycetota bacterium]